MYNINMIIDNPTLYKLKVENLRILFGKVVRLEQWSSTSLKASYWRCYCPLERGGIIYFNENEVKLRPGKGYLIPALTDFRGDIEAPFIKVFCHFEYEASNLSFAPGIYPFDIDAKTMATLNSYLSPQADYYRLQQLIFLLVGQGLTELPDSCLSTVNRDSRVNLILEIMKKHISDGISNSVLAEKIHMTEPSMIRLFREHVGMSPQKYHGGLRMKHACELLSHSDLSIDEIAEACGYWDRNHFSRSFRKFWNVPPATYRKNQGQR